MMTSSVATIIQAVSPLFATGAGAAAADAASAGAAAAAGAVAAAVEAAGAEAAASCASDAPAKPRAARPRAREAISFLMVVVSSMLGGSERVLAGLAGADADDLLEGGHEDLAVTDLAGASGGFDRFDHTLDDRVVDRGFDLHLGQEVDHVLRAAVQLGVALLPAEALDLGHRDALNADAAQGL